MCTQRGELNLVCDVHTLFSRAEYGRRSRFAAVEGLLQNLFITYTWIHTNNTYRLHIEDLFLRPAVSVLLLFVTLPDWTQNQTAVSDTLRLFSDF